MTYYLKKKNELRDKAKKIQAQISSEHLAWWDIYDYQEELEKEARKYGLIREFKREGVL